MTLDLAPLAEHRDQLRGDALIDPGSMVAGLEVIVSDLLPMPSSPGEDARRFVRHAYASKRRATGEAIHFPDSLGDVGPLPGDPTHVLATPDRMIVSEAAWKRIFGYVEATRTGVRRGM